MKRFGWIALAVIVLGGVAITLPSCGKNLSCGAGTVEMNGQCVQAGAPVVTCGDGGVLIGGNCYPVICGTNTKFNPATGMCEGTGGNMTGGCSATCSAPGSQTFCITGTAKSFVDPTMVVGPTATSHAVVRVYDPIMFVTNPNTPPAATVNVEDMGCFIADGVPRFSSGLVAVSVDDMDMAGPGGTYATMGSGAILHANQNVTGQIAFMLTVDQANVWQNDIGSANPPGCTGGLTGCGAWIGLYLAHDGMTPVSGVSPTRQNNSDNPAPGNVFCFDTDRAHLVPTLKTTGALGMCIISPDVVEGHAGRCNGTCMCGGAACAATPTYTDSTGGSTSGVFFFQPFVSTM